MHVSRLQLNDFRSYRGVEITPAPDVNILIGPNGHGKTNVLEAVYYFATLGSHRVAGDAPLVRNEASRAVIHATVVENSRELTLDLEITPGKVNRARLNRNSVTPRQILGALRAILFSPEDLALVKGDPSIRRRFLDDLLVLQAPRWAGVRSDYDKTLKQRNALLRTASLARRAASTSDLRTLDVWDGHLARCGALLLRGRLELLTALTPYVSKAYAAVSDGKGDARLSYRSSIADDSNAHQQADHHQGRSDDDLGFSTEQAEDLMKAALVKARASEIERGVTLVGPHRDDMQLDLSELPARGYASHGESWSYALALRLASYELLRNQGVQPVLLLDDVFAELDERRRNRLAALVANAGQLWVTCAVEADLPPELRGRRFEVMSGEVNHAH